MRRSVCALGRPYAPGHRSGSPAARDPEGARNRWPVPGRSARFNRRPPLPWKTWSNRLRAGRGRPAPGIGPCAALGLRSRAAIRARPPVRFASGAGPGRRAQPVARPPAAGEQFRELGASAASLFRAGLAFGRSRPCPLAAPPIAKPPAPPEDAGWAARSSWLDIFPAVLRFSLLPHRQKGVFYV